MKSTPAQLFKEAVRESVLPLLAAAQGTPKAKAGQRKKDKDVTVDHTAAAVHSLSAEMMDSQDYAQYVKDTPQAAASSSKNGVSPTLRGGQMNEKGGKGKGKGKTKGDSKGKSKGKGKEKGKVKGEGKGKAAGKDWRQPPTPSTPWTKAPPKGKGKGKGKGKSGKTGGRTGGWQ